MVEQHILSGVIPRNGFLKVVITGASFTGCQCIRLTRLRLSFSWLLDGIPQSLRNRLTLERLQDRLSPFFLDASSYVISSLKFSIGLESFGSIRGTLGWLFLLKKSSTLEPMNLKGSRGRYLYAPRLH